MSVEILSTGAELLRGTSVDTNAPWLSQRLEKRGYAVSRVTTVGDALDDIVDAIRAALSRVEIVLLTGGLGPTEDDRTRDAAACAFDAPLRYHEPIFRNIRARFHRARLRMARINRRQAFLPEGAWELVNNFGTAPGFGMRHDGKLFFAMPGVPSEMKPMFERHVLPRLPKRTGRIIREFRAVGIPEGDVDEIIARDMRRAAGLDYGLTVSGGVITIVLKTTRRGMAGRLQRVARAVQRKLGGHFLGEGRCSVEEVVFSKLKNLGETLSIAESCTGGLVAHRLTDVPGVSAVLRESMVVYSNEAKVKRLGVSATLIARHGAVSAPVARAMAKGAAESSGSDVGLSITGIAGPSGGTAKKPVGLVFMAVARRGRVRVQRRLFAGDRSQIKRRAATAALDLLRTELR